MKRGDVVMIYRNGFAPFEAKMMAIADGWAMLRRKGCMPSVQSVKDLERWQKLYKTMRV